MEPKLALDLVSLLQKFLQEFVRGRREDRQDGAKLLRSAANEVDRLVTSCKSLSDLLAIKSASATMECEFSTSEWRAIQDAYLDFRSACYGISALMLKSRAGLDAVERLQETATDISLSPGIIMKLWEYVLPDGRIPPKTAVYLPANREKSQVETFASVMRQVHGARIELVRVAAELRATATLLESGAAEKRRTRVPGNG